MNKDPGLKTGRRFHYGYVIIAAGFLIWLTGATYSSVFSVLLKPITDEFGWSRADVTLGYSLALLTQGVLAIVMGRLTDKLGPRIVITVFGSFLGISYLLLSRIDALWQYQANYALIGAVGLSTITVPVMATVARWFVRRRGFMMGIVQTGLGLGGLIYAPLVAWLTLNYNWRFAYFVLGIATLAGMVIPGLFMKSSPGAIQTGDTQAKSPKSAVKGLSIKQAIKTRPFWIIAGMYFSFGFCRSTFMPHTAPYVQDKGFSLTDGANAVAVLTVASLFGRIIMGRVADEIGHHRALLISESLTTVSLIIGLVAGNLPALFVYAAIFGFGWGAQAVLRFAVSSETFGLASVGIIMGVLGLAEAVAGAFGTYLAGYIYDALGSYALAFWLGIIVSLVGIALVPLKTASGKVNI